MKALMLTAEEFTLIINVMGKFKLAANVRGDLQLPSM